MIWLPKNHQIDFWNRMIRKILRKNSKDIWFLKVIASQFVRKDSDVLLIDPDIFYVLIRIVQLKWYLGNEWFLPKISKKWKFWFVSRKDFWKLQTIDNVCYMYHL